MLSVQALLKMNQPALNELWSDTTAGETPLGVYDGTIIAVPGRQVINRALARHVKTFAWQGKTFVPGAVINRINGQDIIAAQVYRAPSFYDAMECIALDYSATPLVERLRDELRQIAPTMYLGKAYRNRQELLFFALEAVDPTVLVARVAATSSASPTT